MCYFDLFLLHWELVVNGLGDDRPDQGNQELGEGVAVPMKGFIVLQHPPTFISIRTVEVSIMCAETEGNLLITLHKLLQYNVISLICNVPNLYHVCFHPLAELVNFFQISANHTTIFPNPNGLAIEGIRVHDGLACTQCDYVCCTNGSADKHNQNNHNSAQTPLTPCKAQTLFYPTPRHFFSVIIPKPTFSSMTCYDLFADQMLPTIPGLSIGEPSEREISPLLSMTQWHIHLKDWHREPPKRKQLKSLVSAASSQEPWSKVLVKAVESYMRDIRDLANAYDYIVLKKIMQGIK